MTGNESVALFHKKLVPPDCETEVVEADSGTGVDLDAKGICANRGFTAHTPTSTRLPDPALQHIKLKKVLGTLGAKPAVWADQLLA